MNQLSPAARFGLTYKNIDRDFPEPKTRDEAGVLQAVDNAIATNKLESRVWKDSIRTFWKAVGQKTQRGEVGPAIVTLGEAVVFSAIGGFFIAKDAGVDNAVLSSVRRGIIKGAPLLGKVSEQNTVDVDAIYDALRSK